MNRIDLPKVTEREQTQACFNLVLAHDNEVAAVSARFSLGCLLAVIPNMDVHLDQWSFSELAHAEFQREALELAAACDLFVLATTEGEALPASVVGWLDRWVQTRERKETALVCLVGSPDGKLIPSPVHDTLQELAETHHFAFFASSFATAGRQATPWMRTPAEKHPSSLRFDLNRTRPEGWGINE